MDLSFVFFFNSILLGIGLAMDAFSVSLANGLNEPCMKKNRCFMIAAIFALFQYAMPMIGWVCVHTIMQYFTWFEKLIPWIALALLTFIGSKMLFEAFSKKECEEKAESLGITALLIQGVATSIDALSVGFTIADYNITNALLCGLLIAIVTFGICLSGIYIGKKFGTKLANKAGILGGAILIFIGIEIFITGIIK